MNKIIITETTLENILVEDEIIENIEIEDFLPTIDERLEALEVENALLREESALTANALDEFIQIVLGGGE